VGANRLLGKPGGLIALHQQKVGVFSEDPYFLGDWVDRG
jgi:hypothetical protein